MPLLVKLARAAKPRPLTTRDCLGARLEVTADQFPRRTAVQFEGETLTWEELNGLSNRYAGGFRQLGLARGDVVSVMMENRVAFLAVLLGLNKLGVTAALINTNLTGRPLAHCIRTTGSMLCVFGGDVLGAIEGVRPELEAEGLDRFLFVADGDGDSPPDWAEDAVALTAELSAENPPETGSVTLGDTALYLFTSGTTGLPKAAVVSNRRLPQTCASEFTMNVECQTRMPKNA